METARRSIGLNQGLGQLSLVEHALCPLDVRTSLQPNLRYQAHYQFTDSMRRRRTAQAEVIAPLGLSATDEYFLWGLLALTFAQSTPEQEFAATPHYCLRQLGVIDSGSRRGGRQYRQFTQSLERLSTVTYRNDAFYDPVRAEHRQVSFGFLSYSLPRDPESSRAWRIAWNAIFFEFVAAAGGYFRFDLATYRELDPAARRLFLFVSKIFNRCTTTPRLGLRHLGENIIGFAESLATRELKRKVSHALARLAELGVLEDFERAIRKDGKGEYSVLLNRGPYYQLRQQQSALAIESPLLEPLLGMGFDGTGASRLLRKYPASMLREWIDIALAARERFGNGFFTKSPAAYLVDNLRQASDGKRTPPDWWLEIRRAEQDRAQQRAIRLVLPNLDEKKPDETVKNGSLDAYEQIRRDVFARLIADGKAPMDAVQLADRVARRQSAGASKTSPSSMTKIGDLLKH